ncbi:hypothetical protein PIB30_059137 [Stylosanthes scabra]|uniref:Uncharacterized protein n=1 Tax=Stylosanthes scabra TaxID=79078 RepID=A0ABU6WMX7_9FABA|nr:hypothetical protein [Stylosanthes scabra]
MGPEQAIAILEVNLTLRLNFATVEISPVGDGNRNRMGLSSLFNRGKEIFMDHNTPIKLKDFVNNADCPHGQTKTLKAVNEYRTSYTYRLMPSDIRVLDNEFAIQAFPSRLNMGLRWIEEKRFFGVESTCEGEHADGRLSSNFSIPKVYETTMFTHILPM